MDELFSPEFLKSVRSELGRESRDAESRYEVGELLGTGSVSVVHRGLDRQLGRPVALKFLRDTLAGSGKAGERFLREAHSLALMDHPHVLKVYDVGTLGERSFLVMELVPGVPFTEVLRREAPGSPRLLTLLEQVARGVHHAHGKGVVHRDLKPDNVLVTDAGQAKVVDFGLAHLAESGPALTHTGTVMGTPLYMAPEQVEGRRDISARTDVYALGAMLYQILAGRPPFNAQTIPEAYARILKEEPAAPPGAPADLTAVALKALEKDPRRRFASAEEFAEELRRHLAGESTRTRPLPAALRAARTLGRHRIASAVAVVLLLLSSALLVLWLRDRNKLRDTLARATVQESDRRLRAARDEFLQATALDPSSAAAQEGVVRTTQALQKAGVHRDAARTLLDQCVAASYDDRIDPATIPQAATAALNEIQQALALSEDFPEAFLREGEALEILGALDPAAASYRKAIALDPLPGPTRYRLGRVVFWKLTMDPGDPTALARVVIEEFGAARPEDLQQALAAVMIAFLQGQRAGAAGLCDEGIRRSGNARGVEEFHWLRGLCGDRSQAARWNASALALRPRFLPALVELDRELAIRIAPRYMRTILDRGSQRIVEGDESGALADFETVMASGEHGGPAYLGRALLRLHFQKNLAAAIADVTDALQRDPFTGDDLPMKIRAEARLLQGDAAGAIQDATAGLAIRESGFLRAVRGRAKALSGDREGALADLRQAGTEGADGLHELHHGPRRALSGMSETPSSRGVDELEVVHAATGLRVAACNVRLVDSAGNAVRPSKDLPYWSELSSFPGLIALELPPGTYSYDLERGPEFENIRGVLTLKAGTPTRFTAGLPSVGADLRAEGWWPGDLHIARPLRELRLAVEAEDLALAPLLGSPARSGGALRFPAAATDGGHPRFVSLRAQKDERGGGALLYFNLPRPLDLPPQRGDAEHPSSMTVLLEARRQAGVHVDLEKPIWGDTALWLASGMVDSMGVANNLYGRGGIRGDLPAGAIDAARYTMPQRLAWYMQDMYYHALNSGLRIAPSAGSGSGLLSNGVGYNRVYVHLDDGMDDAAWWNGLRAGRSFVTNGPLLRVTANGRWPGEVFSGPVSLDLSATLTTRDPVVSLEVIQNGEVIRRVPVSDGRRFQGALGKVTFQESGWVLVRAISDSGDNLRFASTAPWTVEIGGKPRVSRASAQFYLDWERQRMSRISLSDAAQRNEVLEIHRKAEQFWIRKVADATAP